VSGDREKAWRRSIRRTVRHSDSRTRWNAATPVFGSNLGLPRLAANDGGAALRQCADGARRIDSKSLRHDGSIDDVKVLVVEDFAGVVDHSVELRIAHAASAQWMRRDQGVQERPRGRNDWMASGGRSQCEMHGDDRVDGLFRFADVPGEVEARFASEQRV